MNAIETNKYIYIYYIYNIRSRLPLQTIKREYYCSFQQLLTCNESIDCGRYR